VFNGLFDGLIHVLNIFHNFLILKLCANIDMHENATTMVIEKRIDA